MDLASLDAFLKVKKMNVDRGELRRLFDDRIQSLCPLEGNTAPGFTELYLFVTACEPGTAVALHKILDKLRNAVGDAGIGGGSLAEVFQAEFGSTATVVKIDKVRAFLVGKGITSITASDWAILGEVFVDPLGIKADRKKKKKRMHWPSFVRIVDPPVELQEQQKVTNAETTAETAANPVDDILGGASESPLSAEGVSPANGWVLLKKCKSLSEAVDLRMKKKDGTLCGILSKSDFGALRAWDEWL